MLCCFRTVWDVTFLSIAARWDWLFLRIVFWCLLFLSFPGPPRVSREICRVSKSLTSKSMWFCNARSNSPRSWQLQYSSPEEFEGSTIDEKSDTYSMGNNIYVLVSTLLWGSAFSRLRWQLKSRLTTSFTPLANIIADGLVAFLYNAGKSGS